MSPLEHGLPLHPLEQAVLGLGVLQQLWGEAREEGQAAWAMRLARPGRGDGLR